MSAGGGGARRGLGWSESNDIGLTRFVDGRLGIVLNHALDSAVALATTSKSYIAVP